MSPSFETLHDRFQNSLDGFLWDQWVAIGVAGAARNPSIPFIIDPEALLLASTQFAGHDSRLMEEVLDWILANGDLLNLQRLKNVNTSFQIGSSSVLREIATIASASGQTAWKKLLTFGAEKPRVPSVYGEDIRTRGMSFHPDPNRPEAFLFRMRAIFGLNARPEILTWLLTHSSGHPALIARETSWFSKSVQAALNEMGRSGLLDSRVVDRRKVFQLVERDQWTSLFQPDGELRWFAQGAFYLASAHLRETLASLSRKKDASPGLQSMIIRDRLPSIRAALELAGIAEGADERRRRTGDEMVNAFRAMVAQVCGVMEREGESLLSEED